MLKWIFICNNNNHYKHAICQKLLTFSWAANERLSQKKRSLNQFDGFRANGESSRSNKFTFVWHRNQETNWGVEWLTDWMTAWLAIENSIKAIGNVALQSAFGLLFVVNWKLHTRSAMGPDFNNQKLLKLKDLATRQAAYGLRSRMWAKSLGS